MDKAIRCNRIKCFLEKSILNTIRKIEFAKILCTIITGHKDQPLSPNTRIKNAYPIGLKDRGLSVPDI